MLNFHILFTFRNMAKEINASQTIKPRNKRRFPSPDKESVASLGNVPIVKAETTLINIPNIITVPRVLFGCKDSLRFILSPSN